MVRADRSEIAVRTSMTTSGRPPWGHTSAPNPVRSSTGGNMSSSMGNTRIIVPPSKGDRRLQEVQRPATPARIVKWPAAVAPTFDRRADRYRHRPESATHQAPGAPPLRYVDVAPRV